MIDLIGPATTGESAGDDIDKVRREQFRHVNASLALEGMVVDAADQDIQNAIAEGRLTHDQAVAEYLHRVRGSR